PSIGIASSAYPPAPSSRIFPLVSQPSAIGAPNCACTCGFARALAMADRYAPLECITEWMIEKMPATNAPTTRMNTNTSDGTSHFQLRISQLSADGDDPCGSGGGAAAITPALPTAAA